MDSRHIGGLMAAASAIYGEAIDVAVWVKPKAAPASLYHSDLEFIGVFRIGNTASHTIARRRSRSNIWHHAAVKSLNGLRSLPKPVALIADAIQDCTRKGDIVLDLFSGSGSTIMAAERVGRCAHRNRSTIGRSGYPRWQGFTRKDAVHAERRDLRSDRGLSCRQPSEQDRTQP
jgi:hypothetical protein